MEIKYFNEDCAKISKSCDLEFGKSFMSLSPPNNLLSNNLKFNKNGFGIFRLKNDATFIALEKVINNYIFEKLSSFQKVSEFFNLSQYHNFLKNESIHYKVSTWAIDYEQLGDLYFEIKEQIELILDLKLSIKKIEHLGKEGKYVGFRILRPGKTDHNPFHRDAWLPYWRDTINVWIPICGFENGNTLQLIPNSHLWNDSEILKTKVGAEIDKKKYHVPAAIGTINKFSIKTPILKKGEGLIFSPYLIHGNGINKRDNITRVSMEFRFYKKQ